MHDWTLGSFLFWLLIAIAVPALLVHFTLGRNGGHHLFAKDRLTSEATRKLPLTMLKNTTRWRLKGSAATLLGLMVALVLYPLGCMIGLPINVFGIPDETFVYLVALGVAVLVMLGPVLYRKWRDA